MIRPEAVEDVGLLLDGVNLSCAPKEYDVNEHPLDIVETRLALAMEVARRMDCSMEEAAKEYTIETAYLSGFSEANTQRQVSTFGNLDNTIESLGDKPHIIMVNYSAGGDRAFVPHWVPVILSQKDGSVSIDVANSESDLYDKPLKDYVDQIQKAVEKVGKQVQRTDHERHALVGQACGIDSAFVAASCVCAVKEGMSASEGVNRAVRFSPYKMRKQGQKSKEKNGAWFNRSVAKFNEEGREILGRIEFLKEEKNRGCVQEKFSEVAKKANYEKLIYKSGHKKGIRDYLKAMPRNLLRQKSKDGSSKNFT